MKLKHAPDSGIDIDAFYLEFAMLDDDDKIVHFHISRTVLDELHANGSSVDVAGDEDTARLNFLAFRPEIEAAASRLNEVGEPPFIDRLTLVRPSRI